MIEDLIPLIIGFGSVVIFLFWLNSVDKKQKEMKRIYRRHVIKHKKI